MSSFFPLLVAYFTCGLLFFTYTMSNIVRAGVFSRVMEEGQFHKFMAGLLAMNFLLWPFSLIVNALVASNPTATANATKWLRRRFIDRDDRFTRPEMPAMPAICGSCFRVLEDPHGGFATCVRPRNHAGKHGNRHPSFPHDDAACPCAVREWTDEESACTWIEIKQCSLHGKHEGKCRTATGEEFDPTPFGAGPPPPLF